MELDNQYFSMRFTVEMRSEGVTVEAENQPIHLGRAGRASRSYANPV